MIAVLTRSAADTEDLAARVAGALAGGEVLLLKGELGAGKTCFTRGLARGLGIDPRVVKSPSYNILHQYDGGRLRLQHFDAYFVREEEEYRRAGLDDFLAAGDVVVVEWGERHADEFPAAALCVNIDHVDEHERRIEFSDRGEAARRSSKAPSHAEDPDLLARVIRHLADAPLDRAARSLPPRDPRA